MLVAAVRCPVCARAKEDEVAARVLVRPETQTMAGARITTEIVQRMQCKEQHAFLLNIQDGGHALLYERALERLALGRTRDAVLDAYTALDMFLGWIVLGTAFERRNPNGPLDDTTLDVLRQELKDVLKAAERTLGAAFTLAAVTSGRAPPKWNSRLQEIRNKAVHAGVYPSDEDAEWACLEVERLVRELSVQLPLSTIEGGPLRRFHMALTVEAHRRALGDLPPPVTITLSLMTVLGSSGDPQPRNAKDRVAEYRRGDRPLLID